MVNQIYYKHYYVYMIINTVPDDKIDTLKIYIGCHRTNDLDDHYMGSGTRLKKALAKYGKRNFKRVILHECENYTDMYAIEAALVDWDFVKRKDTYNMYPGGHPHKGMSAEGKHNRINKLRGRHLTDEHKQKLRDALKNPSQETRDKISKIHKGSKRSEETRRKMSEAKKHQSAETIRKIQEARKGYKHSDVTKKKIGRKCSDVTKKKISEALKG